MTVATATELTAKEFVDRYSGQRVELVKGVVKELPMGGARHGFVCARATVIFTLFVESNDRGRVMCNDTYVLTRRNPDTVRGGDVCFWSYQRLPKDAAIPAGIVEAPPDLVVEVRSPNDRWIELYTKAMDYLAAGVTAVVILDPDTATASVFRPDEIQQVFDNGDDLVLPDVLPGFSHPVRKFFEA